MRRIHHGNYSRAVIDIVSLVLGVAIGTLIAAFAAIGSYGRGFDSVRRGAWRRELVARKRAVKAATAARVAAAPTHQPGLRQAG